MSYIRDGAAFFNGPVYTEYGHLYAEGTPYFRNANITEGKVVFDGLLHEGRFLIFDVLQQKLVTKTLSGGELFEVSIPSVTAFEIGDVRFVKLNISAKSDMLPGFYEVLFKGSKIQLLCKQQKELVEEMIGTSLKKSLLDKEKYYVQYNGDYYAITNRRSLYKAFPAARDELKKVARSSNLNFKTDLRTALIETVKHLNDSSISQL
ncbi:hypothetical protein U0035_01020 [Niabella yanshanensis]|uniref:Uncharacterized protein n=1 Tax=Niabella yanshanensis TaxID=577386 RepID=A0ABZ0W703_9BACT|nr:hypothetical protein [Niabella yanshanensis]WQD38724.1 hypothetical protein U0035_01020 [Niabella yanshanensis]